MVTVAGVTVVMAAAAVMETVQVGATVAAAMAVPGTAAAMGPEIAPPVTAQATILELLGLRAIKVIQVTMTTQRDQIRRPIRQMSAR